MDFALRSEVISNTNLVAVTNFAAQEGSVLLLNPYTEKRVTLN